MPATPGRGARTEADGACAGRAREDGGEEQRTRNAPQVHRRPTAAVAPRPARVPLAEAAVRRSRPAEAELPFATLGDRAGVLHDRRGEARRGAAGSARPARRARRRAPGHVSAGRRSAPSRGPAARLLDDSAPPGRQFAVDQKTGRALLAGPETCVALARLTGKRGERRVVAARACARRLRCAAQPCCRSRNAVRAAEGSAIAARRRRSARPAPARPPAPSPVLRGLPRDACRHGSERRPAPARSVRPVASAP